MCDRKGCSELFCEDCVLGIKAGYAKAKAAGLTDDQLWLICLWCSGKTAPYQVSMYIPASAFLMQDI